MAAKERLWAMWKSSNKKHVKKALEILLFIGLALALCLAVWQVFLKEDKNVQSLGNTEEERLVAILEQMDGVGDAEVMIGVSENGNKSVVIVCDGADRLSVIMDVREAAATALGIEEKFVKIYLKNNG